MLVYEGEDSGANALWAGMYINYDDSKVYVHGYQGGDRHMQNMSTRCVSGHGISLRDSHTRVV